MPYYQHKVQTILKKMKMENYQRKNVSTSRGMLTAMFVMGVTPRNSEDAEYFENNWRTNKGEEIYR